MLNVSLKGLGIRGSFYAHRLSHGSFKGDRGDEGGVLAAVPWNFAVGPLSSGSPGVKATHGGVKATLVHQYKAPGVKVGSKPLPQTPRLLLAL